MTDGIIKDSGNRREFETGAVRDMAEGKGRCDLMPMEQVSKYLAYNYEEIDLFDAIHNLASLPVLDAIAMYQKTGLTCYLYRAMCTAIAPIREMKIMFKDDMDIIEPFSDWREIGCSKQFEDRRLTSVLELAKHFEGGAKKYGECNWQKGIETKFYIDSGVRHYIKWYRGDKDEPHDRAFMWNMICCIWTCDNKPELNSYSKKEKKKVAVARKVKVTSKDVAKKWAEARSKADAFNYSCMCDGCTHLPDTCDCGKTCKSPCGSATYTAEIVDMKYNDVSTYLVITNNNLPEDDSNKHTYVDLGGDWIWKISHIAYDIVFLYKYSKIMAAEDCEPMLIGKYAYDIDRRKLLDLTFGIPAKETLY